MLSKIPTKLGKEPLVDAMFEVRVACPTSLATVMPGFFLFKHADIGREVQRLALADVPQGVRDSNPELQFQPLLRLEYGDHFVNVGDKVVVVGCKLPYKGWKAFKAVILKILGSVAELGVVAGISACSLRYLDIVDTTVSEQDISKLDVQLAIAGNNIAKQKTAIQTQIADGRFSHHVGITTADNIQVVGRGVVNGIAVDVKTVEEYQQPHDMPSFVATLPATLEAIHDSNKNFFFACLTDELIAKLDPSYE